MSPCRPVPITQRSGEQAAPLSTIDVALSAVVGPLSGLPCCAHVVPSFVATTVPPAPSAKQSFASTHAMPLSACVDPLTRGVHVTPPSVEPSKTAAPETTAPA